MTICLVNTLPKKYKFEKNVLLLQKKYPGCGAVG